MDPFTLALATFGVQKLRGKSTKRALRDAVLMCSDAHPLPCTGTSPNRMAVHGVPHLGPHILPKASGDLINGYGVFRIVFYGCAMPEKYVKLGCPTLSSFDSRSMAATL